MGALYGQYPPLVNAVRAPGVWNSYDIVWRAPVFQGGKLASPALITVLLNNLVLHHAQPLRGPTDHKVVTEYRPHAAKGPIELQDHGDLVRYRNIWVRELLGYDV